MNGVLQVTSKEGAQAFQDALEMLAALAEKLRETAAGLDDKSIHPAHAANRLRKMARGIDGGK